MEFKVIATEPFMRKLKKLSKKYKSISKDLSTIIIDLSNNPNMGVPLGKDCYKIRLAIASKGKGKSGGARIITYIKVIKQAVYLLDIYDKSSQANIPDAELIFLIDLLSKD